MIVKIKEPGSAGTHFIGILASLIAAIPLLRISVFRGSSLGIISFAVFAVSMVLLYTASTVYHTFDISTAVNSILQQFDHAAIYLLIAGSYTPICLLALPHKTGIPLLVAVWLFGLTGIGITIRHVSNNRWLCSVIYVIMGWLCAAALVPIFRSLQRPAFFWLLSGGILYTIGGVIYALKLKEFNAKHPVFGTHEIFHVFVLAGSLCHYVTMFYVA